MLFDTNPYRLFLALTCFQFQDIFSASFQTKRKREVIDLKITGSTQLKSHYRTLEIVRYLTIDCSLFWECHMIPKDWISWKCNVTLDKLLFYKFCQSIHVMAWKYIVVTSCQFMDAHYWFWCCFCGSENLISVIRIMINCSEDFIWSRYKRQQ